MSIKKALFIFGTRPEAIKMAPVVLEFKKHTREFKTLICVTGQHRQMLDQVLETFGIIPDVDLDMMKPNQDLFDITSNVLLKLRDVLRQIKPDVVFVHGDTTTSFAATLAAYYERIDVAHVEAGLRTNNIYSPFPEEVNRQLTSKITKYHFAPTELSKQNLIKENISEKNIFITGNTVIDSLKEVVKNFDLDKPLINEYKISSRNFILVTGHRRENFGEGFINICEALKEIAEKNPLIDIVYPVHLNPNVQEPVKRLLGGINNVYLITPLDYVPFIYLLSKSYLVLTDSGGIQEEAPSLGKPVLVMRDNTERPEAIEAGTVKLVGTNKGQIVLNTLEIINNSDAYDKMSMAHNPYGDGLASQRIVDVIKKELFV